MSVAVPDVPNLQRPAVDVYCVIDISGSMGADATYEKEDGSVHSNGLTVLCIAKHAIKVVIASLSPLDRLGVVAFDQVAEVAFPLTHLDDAGRARAIAAVSALRPRGQTNIMGGLRMAMDRLREAPQLGNNQSVLLLTDGKPNVSPKKGEIAAFSNYMKRHPEFQCQVVTFGFGYGLDSELLYDLAHVGNGSYAFIPTAPVMGTGMLFLFYYFIV